MMAKPTPRMPYAAPRKIPLAVSWATVSASKTAKSNRQPPCTTWGLPSVVGSPQAGRAGSGLLVVGGVDAEERLGCDLAVLVLEHTHAALQHGVRLGVERVRAHGA